MLHPRIYPWLDLNQQPLPSKGNASCQLGYRGKLKSEWQGSNLRHSASKAGALPTALHPDILLVGVEPTRELFLRELPLPIGLQELILDTPGETRTHTWTIFEIVASSDWATGVYYTALPGLEPRILEPKSRVLPITPQGNEEREGFEPSLDFISNQPFQDCALSHSATSPKSKKGSGWNRTSNAIEAPVLQTFTHANRS